MMDGVNVFIKQYLTDIIGTGIGCGLFLGFVSGMFGYMFGKVQSFFENH